MFVEIQTILQGSIEQEFSAVSTEYVLTTVYSVDPHFHFFFLFLFLLP